MRKIFKTGDNVYYGVVPGTILGIFNTNKVLFFSDSPRQNFYSFKELRVASRNDAPTLMFFVRDEFGTKLTTVAKQALKQKRFIIVTLSELKHSSKPKTNLDQLFNKRHLYLVMAKHYARTNYSDEKIERICSKVEAIQLEIDAEEKCLMSH